ncbi:MAG: DUF2141 domain-containing protein [Calditrichae bacterium]|nr:DUF2141 domain-containing protein [Calditrichia bacterium]
MMLTTCKPAFILVFALILTTHGWAENAGLEVEITNIDNTEGNVLISIYDQEDNFPYQPFKTYSVEKESLVDGKLEFFIPDIKLGVYAITLLDDKNRNNDMDTNWLGIPNEGFGFSNNVKPTLLGAPPFKKCTFKIKQQDSGKIIIQMQYL